MCSGCSNVSQKNISPRLINKNWKWMEEFHNHKIFLLKLKLYLSSQMQLLTLFYFEFVCN